MSAAVTVGGVPVVLAAETELDAGERRQRVCTELLRQAAMRAGLLAADDPAPLAGAISSAASTAIETLLDQALPQAEPDEAACRRHFEAHTARHAVGERLLLRHVLFAITPGLDLAAMRRRAEACLLELRAAQRAPGEADAFAETARQWSNCPSGAEGGALGWLQADDCAEEFARAVFGATEVGVLPRLVTSRHGLHVVEVLAREPGRVPAFEEVRGAVALALAQQRFATELRRYLDTLAAAAEIEGLDFEATTA
jgi:peptidyl-prolyl cis-trans isomerase C